MKSFEFESNIQTGKKLNIDRLKGYFFCLDYCYFYLNNEGALIYVQRSREQEILINITKFQR